MLSRSAVCFYVSKYKAGQTQRPRVSTLDLAMSEMTGGSHRSRNLNKVQRGSEYEMQTLKKHGPVMC